MRWSSSFPTIVAFAQQRGARLPHCPVPGFLTGPRFDASPAFACAPVRRVARLSTRPTPFEVAETFTPELSPPQVTPRRSRVSLRSCLDPCCGGTCTRWDSAVMGCNFAPPAFAGFLATTRHSAPVPRLGTSPLGRSAPWRGSLGIGTTGSHVPQKSRSQADAAFMPDTTQVVSRAPPGLLPGYPPVPVSVSSRCLSTRHQRFTPVRLPDPYLTRSSAPFPHRSPRRLLTNAA